MGPQRRLPLLLLFLAVFHPQLTSGDSDPASDRAALLALRASVGGRQGLWNPAAEDACKWAGVQCDGGRVTALRLPAAALYGQIPTGTIGNLTALRTLSLRFNALSGPLPADLSRCADLRNLNLQWNRFSGQIPAALFDLGALARVDLSGNNFSGPIAPGFNNLTHLKTLNLENNALVGSLPEGLKFESLEQFNVSFNQLNGSVPSSLASFPKSSFLGTSLCGGPLDPCSGNGSAPEPSPVAAPSPLVVPSSSDGGVDDGKKKGLSGWAIVGIVIGSVVGFLLVVLILFFLCRKKSSTRTRAVDSSMMKPGGEQVDIPGEKQIGEVENGRLSNGYSSGAAIGTSRKEESGANGGNKKLLFFGNAARVFDLEDLLRASAEVLGKGTFGTAYKAVLEVGMVVAVKRLKDVISSEREFKEKIEVVGSMDHENLVPLRAYYYSREEKLLVYDYMPMGSLSALLHGNKGAGRTPLNWELRSSIALGAARGIACLHARSPNISHGNIKSSNILLTKSYEARVSDFGLAHLVGPPSNPTRVAGYRAPEVTDPRNVSQKADVYSFGILLLELLTGKAPTHALLNEEGVDLPRWVQSVVREEWTSEVFDLELLRDQNVEEMVQLLQLAMDCANQYPDKRPSMSEVINQIEELRRSSIREYQDPHSNVDDLNDDASSQ